MHAHAPTGGIHIQQNSNLLTNRNKVSFTLTCINNLAEETRLRDLYRLFVTELLAPSKQANICFHSTIWWSHNGTIQ